MKNTADEAEAWARSLLTKPSEYIHMYYYRLQVYVRYSRTDSALDSCHPVFNVLRTHEALKILVRYSYRNATELVQLS